MAITDYTTSISIRAAIGVSDDELESATIEDIIYSVQLDEALHDLGPTLADDYTTVKNSTPPLTKDQTRFVNLINTWAAYTVSTMLMTSLPMFAPKEIKSDKDALTRIDDPYKDVRTNIVQSASTLAGRILKLYAQLFPSQKAPTAVTYINVISVGLPSDPVTGV